MKKIIYLLAGILAYFLSGHEGIKDITKKSQETIARDSSGNMGAKA